MLAGPTRHPTAEWKEQVARNLTDSESEFSVIRATPARPRHEVLLGFRSILLDEGLQPLRLPARSPNLNAFAERWVRSVKQECLSKLILFSKASLKSVLTEYTAHYHTERNHQGKHNLLLFPSPADASPPDKRILCKRRLGGLFEPTGTSRSFG
jgi:hypothetical protein